MSIPRGSLIEGVREGLTANRTYYVRTDGSDANDGLADTSAGAFLTLQKAWDTVAALDMSIYTATIQIADGTYTAGLAVSSYPVGGEVVIQGNTTTPANVVIQPGSGIILNISAGASILLQGLKLGGGGETTGIFVNDPNAKVRYSLLDFAAVSQSHLHIYYGTVAAAGNWTISGGATRHVYCLYGGRFTAAAVTVTLIGTPAFTRFCEVSNPGLASWFSMTFSGSATGQRYVVTLNGVVNTFGGGATYLPGSTAGAVATGGQYA